MIVAWIVSWLVGRGVNAVFAPLIVYGVMAGGILIGWHFVAEHYRDQGRAEIQTKWDKAVEDEKDRVAKAVAEAQAEAQKTIDALEQKEAELNAELEKARAEADNDPAGNDCGLSADSVLRLNRFR